MAERQLALLWGGLALAAVALQPLWKLLAPHLRPCVFRAVTGVSCPTCGATRATTALLDGRIIDALTLNPLVAGSVAVFILGGVFAPLWAWRKGTAPQLPSPLPIWVRLGIVVAIAANWAWVIAWQ